jgi:hypothetical protein
MEIVCTSKYSRILQFVSSKIHNQIIKEKVFKITHLRGSYSNILEKIDSSKSKRGGEGRVRIGRSGNEGIEVNFPLNYCKKGNHKALFRGTRKGIKTTESVASTQRESFFSFRRGQ